MLDLTFRFEPDGSVVWQLRDSEGVLHRGRGELPQWLEARFPAVAYAGRALLGFRLVPFTEVVSAAAD